VAATKIKQCSDRMIARSKIEVGARGGRETPANSTPEKIGVLQKQERLPRTRE
jgi:hypothetical protein